jgi:hypothetical protein
MRKNLIKNLLLLISLYICIYMKTKLTSVKILKDLYLNFRHKCLDDDMNLQKLVNRSIFLYNNDNVFREKINISDDLFASGSNL